MKKILLMLFCLWPSQAFADELGYFGVWDCVIPGESGVARLSLSLATNLFTLELPTPGGNFRIPFKPILADEDKLGIILLTPAHIAHPVNLIKNGNGITVEFYGEKLAPKLECRRGHAGAIQGH